MAVVRPPRSIHRGPAAAIASGAALALAWAILLAAPAAAGTGGWSLVATTAAIPVGQASAVSLTATNLKGGSTVGCVRVQVPAAFAVTSVGVDAATAPYAWTADPPVAGTAGSTVVRVHGATEADKLSGTGQTVRFHVTVTPASVGVFTWSAASLDHVNCTSGSDAGSALVTVGPALPTPTPTPTPTPVPDPGPDPEAHAGPHPGPDPEPTPAPTRPHAGPDPAPHADPDGRSDAGPDGGPRRGPDAHTRAIRAPRAERRADRLAFRALSHARRQRGNRERRVPGPPGSTGGRGGGAGGAGDPSTGPLPPGSGPDRFAVAATTGSAGPMSCGRRACPSASAGWPAC